MSAPDPELDLRWPWWARAFVVVFPFLFAGVVLLGPDAVDSVVGRVLMVVFAFLVAGQMLRLAAVTTPDGRLRVRNRWSSRLVAASEIEAVEVGPGISSFMRAVRLRLRDGSDIPLDVTETQLGRRHLERQADQVRNWAGLAPRP